MGSNRYSPDYPPVSVQLTSLHSTVLQVPFLNLMANIKDRAGALHIRVGGNTQETATLVDSLPNGLILSKDNGDTNNPVRRVAARVNTSAHQLL